MDEGGDGEECDARAIRVANAAVAKIKEGDMSYKAYTMSTNNVLIPVNAIDVDGEPVPVAELVAAYIGTLTDGDSASAEQEQADEQAVSEAVWSTAFVNDLPDSSFALVEPGGEKDEEGKTKPRSLRHLPYKDSGGKVDVPHLRNALARLPQMKGVAAGLVSKALKKLQAVAKKHLKTYQAEMQAVDLAVCLAESFEVELEEEMAEAQLSESASGHAIGLAETQAAAGGPRAPLLMDVALIQPGWGNKKDRNYYRREVLERDAHVFEGIKMYATDHRPDEKSVRTEVAVIKTCPTRFLDDGTPIALAAVHDGDFAEQARNRAKLGTLSSLECSILATGRTKKGKVDGEKANIVEAIIKGQSVDWVTRGGAGGHAHALVESAGGDDMSDEEQVTTQEQEQEEESQEATLTEDGGGEEITYLAESEVKAALEASRLPPQAQGRLSESRYLDTDALKAAIEQERQYIKEITGSGKPFAQGGGTAPGEEQMSEADYDTAYADILRRHGLHVPQRQEA
jgi:hypothetical protein